MNSLTRFGALFLVCGLAAAASQKAPAARRYDQKGTVISSGTEPKSMYIPANPDGGQPTQTIYWRQPVAEIETATEVLAVMDGARRRIYPLTLGQTVEFREQGGSVCVRVQETKGVAATNGGEHCYLITGRKLRPDAGEATPAPAPTTHPAAPGDSNSATGTLLVVSAPDGAEIYSDGAFVGNAPAALKLSPGKHTLRVTKDGFKDWSREISIQSGAELRLNADLQKGS